tara:strand:+ start:227 stop:424 length:198 start_codon:yes stop_codon:yes gene_type:complete
MSFLIAYNVKYKMSKIMDKIDYSKITDNPKVIELLKKRNEIEKEIREIEEMALVKYEIEYLALDE